MLVWVPDFFFFFFKFDYTANMEGRKEKRTANTVRNCLLFTGTTKNVHVRKTDTGQKRLHTHNSLVLQPPWGSRWKPKLECFGVPLLRSMRSLTAGASVCTPNPPRGAEWTQERECEGCWHQRQAPASPLTPLPSSSCCGGLSHGMAPVEIRAISLTPACPAAAGQDGLHEVYVPDMGKLQRDHGPNTELRPGF